MKAYIYFNLHKKLFSVKVGGIVVAHVDRVHVVDPIFKVSEAGRQRVLREKRKNVHAYVVADWHNVHMRFPNTSDKWKAVSYNPYRAAHFYECDTEREIYNTSEALLYVNAMDKANIIVI